MKNKRKQIDNYPISSGIMSIFPMIFFIFRKKYIIFFVKKTKSFLPVISVIHKSKNFNFVPSSLSESSMKTVCLLYSLSLFKHRSIFFLYISSAGCSLRLVTKSVVRSLVCVVCCKRCAGFVVCLVQCVSALQ